MLTSDGPFKKNGICSDDDGSRVAEGSLGLNKVEVDVLFFLY